MSDIEKRGESLFFSVLSLLEMDTLLCLWTIKLNTGNQSYISLVHGTRFFWGECEGYSSQILDLRIKKMISYTRLIRPKMRKITFLFWCPTFFLCAKSPFVIPKSCGRGWMREKKRMNGRAFYIAVYSEIDIIFYCGNIVGQEL